MLQLAQRAKRVILQLFSLKNNAIILQLALTVIS